MRRRPHPPRSTQRLVLLGGDIREHSLVENTLHGTLDELSLSATGIVEIASALYVSDDLSAWAKCLDWMNGRAANNRRRWSSERRNHRLVARRSAVDNIDLLFMNNSLLQPLIRCWCLRNGSTSCSSRLSRSSTASGTSQALQRFDKAHVCTLSQSRPLLLRCELLLMLPDMSWHLQKYFRACIWLLIDALKSFGIPEARDNHLSPFSVWLRYCCTARR